MIEGIEITGDSAEIVDRTRDLACCLIGSFWVVLGCLTDTLTDTEQVGDMSEIPLLEVSGQWGEGQLHRVKGNPSFSGRVLAVSTMNISSSVVIRRGRPPAH